MTIASDPQTGQASLYRLLKSTSKAGAAEDPPDTINTKAIETIDEDASFALLGVSGLPPN
ncbi:hypothetical protein ACIBF7_43120 [Nonomuraea sp. NPDC050478]|uniref:hypothetical protein n=1 Tax=Nonomuraea sp. NPDC050478 TaxID=3364365 RepID=UPI0037BC8A1A